jgi:hypothetical protein
MASDSNKYSTSPTFNAFGMEDSPNTTDTDYRRAADSLANSGQIISFYHVPSQTEIYFKAFLTNFQETYNSDWSSETVYGRVDPIFLFKNTRRQIALGFKVPAASTSEAYENLGRVQKLIQSLYPNYTTLTDPATGEPDVFAQTISQSPMMRLKVMNILQDQSTHYTATATADEGTELNTYTEISTTGNTLAAGGLLGVIENVTVDHHLHDAEGGALEMGEGVILPKLISINLSFSAIHEHPVGWREDATTDSVNPFFNSLFPYGINLEGSIDSPNSAPAVERPNPVGEPDDESLNDGTDGDTPAPMTDPDAGGTPDAAAAAAAQTAESLTDSTVAGTDLWILLNP